MKLFCVTYVVYVTILTVSEIDEHTRNLLKQVRVCQKDNHVSDLNELMNDPTTETAKCFAACVMNKLGVMDEDNQLVPYKLEKMIFDDTIKTKDGRTLKSMVKDIAEACESVSDEDKCEAAGKIVFCLNAEAKKRGFKKTIF